MRADRLARDLEIFAESWISNPAARLDFALLIGRVADLDVGHRSGADAYHAVRAWVSEEKRTAKMLGIDDGRRL